MTTRKAAKVRLKACPWCGKAPTLSDSAVYAPHLVGRAARYVIGCSRWGHFVRVVGKSVEGATKRWNTRHA